MADFVRVPGEFLAQIATGNDRTPSLYYNRYRLVCDFFWLRLRFLHRLLEKFVAGRSDCLDFGGGGGVFLPTLARMFPRVTCIDLETAEARKVVEHYRLENVRLVQEDICQAQIPPASFDAIIAADVLEHFQDMTLATAALRAWLKDDGYLFTSVPTESALYAGLRRFFGVEKPADHYHEGAEVETFLSQNGFILVKRTFCPLYVGFASLFIISAWRKSSEY
jgi:SAM-dependent methyltransferase